MLRLFGLLYAIACPVLAGSLSQGAPSTPCLNSCFPAALGGACDDHLRFQPLLTSRGRSECNCAWVGELAALRRACHLTPQPSDPVRVFTAKDGNVSCFRIPAIVQTAKGSLLAFAEARRGNCNDGSTEEIAVRRSVDHGRTWSDMSFAVGGPGHKVGNPYPTAMANGSVALVYVDYRQPGRNLGKGNGVVFSHDDGLTWSNARDISAAFGGARGALPGPGAGIQLSSGRILVISHYGPYRGDYITFSDDGGERWQTVNHTFPKMDEGTLADLGGGAVLLNMRHLAEAKRGRAVARSYDGGMTWSNVSYDEALLGPICQGSLAAFGGSVFFSNPAGPHSRTPLKVRRSDDHGHTWSGGLLINSSNGYSSLVQGPVGDPLRGGILYEARERGALDFRTFPLAEEAEQIEVFI